MNAFAALDAAAWSAWGVWATVVVYIVIGLLIWRQVAEAQRLREGEMRPYVVVDFDVFTRRPVIFLTIANHGKTLARNVRFRFDPPLRSSLGQPKPGQVYMRHPEIEGTGGPTSREALETVWKDKGWEEAPPPPVDDALAGVRLLTEGMSTLAPGKTIPILFDSLFERQDRYPDAYRVHVSYDGERRQHFEEEILLDLGVYRNMMMVETRDLTDIYQQLKKLVDSTGRWTSTLDGLKVVSRDDERREYEAWQRDAAEPNAHGQTDTQA